MTTSSDGGSMKRELSLFTEIISSSRLHATKDKIRGKKNSIFYLIFKMKSHFSPERESIYPLECLPFG
jgi:hypothetical protein